MNMTEIFQSDSNFFISQNLEHHKVESQRSFCLRGDFVAERFVWRKSIVAIGCDENQISWWKIELSREGWSRPEEFAFPFDGKIFFQPKKRAWDNNFNVCHHDWRVRLAICLSKYSCEIRIKSALYLNKDFSTQSPGVASTWFPETIKTRSQNFRPLFPDTG